MPATSYPVALSPALARWTVCYTQLVLGIHLLPGQAGRQRVDEVWSALDRTTQVDLMERYDTTEDRAAYYQLERYRITHHSEECACAHCGSPLYVGDRVLLVDDVPACSARCAQELTS